MWYDSSMSNDPIQEALKEAAAAVAYAQTVRQYHRRRTDKKSAQRSTDLHLALDRIAHAMKPLRSEIGRFPQGPQTEAAEAARQPIRDASQALQRERRKIWKMCRP